MLGFYVAGDAGGYAKHKQVAEIEVEGQAISATSLLLVHL